MITKDREIYTVDFDASGFLPISFVAYAFTHTFHKLSFEVAPAILQGLPVNNLEAMSAVRGALVRSLAERIVISTWEETLQECQTTA